MEILTNNEKYILRFFRDVRVTWDTSERTVEVEILSKKELIELKNKINEILKKEKGDQE
jgi:hypothetical protein